MEADVFEEILEEYKNSLIPLKWELESFFS
ncbi:Uncharacterised protein [Streptococcus pneumoniae]|nr:Uncharacterised protein [Streptococcus pneumoniae]